MLTAETLDTIYNLMSFGFVGTVLLVILYFAFPPKT